MSAGAPPTLWYAIIEPDVAGEKPKWAAHVVATDDPSWAELRIIDVDNQTYAHIESVSNSLNLSAFLNGRTNENEWDDLFRAWVAQQQEGDR